MESAVYHNDMPQSTRDRECIRIFEKHGCKLLHSGMFHERDLMFDVPATKSAAVVAELEKKGFKYDCNVV